MAYQKPTTEARHHRRIKSSVLSNISFIHKRTPSTGSILSGNTTTNFSVHPNVNESLYSSPLDSSQSKALGERHNNQQSQPIQHTAPEVEFDKLKERKSFSSISLKSQSKKENVRDMKKNENKPCKPKTKPATNLANLLSRPKSLINIKKEALEERFRIERDKENKHPDKSQEKPFTPIYAQFSTRLEDEINLYTPKDYTPNKQRDFYEIGKRPTLGRRDEPPPRPRSTYLPSSFSIHDLSRRVSGGSRHSSELIRRVSGKKPSADRKASSSIPNSEKSEGHLPSRGQRVIAAVSSTFEYKTAKEPENKFDNLTCEDDVNKEFEAMLDRRNIPDHQRGKMRSLAMSMKKDFIKQDWAEITALKYSKMETGGADVDIGATSAGTNDVAERKSKRPRSRTFTLSKSFTIDSLAALKKTKPDVVNGKNLRKKSNESLNGGNKSFTGTGASVAQNIIAKAKGQCPDDFVSYLVKVPKPEQVEVGRLHKLRLLLRNETVAWTDNFIQRGGMEEIVGLLHRTMAIEWREEHEDALLHEVLLCLKGLSTTALALKCLDKIQETLFPALIHMLFDEEKKGPSEFTTRNIITSLLFTYLKSAPITEREKRARTVLSYLRDPEPIESQRPVGFVLEMRRPRPYRVWCKEVVNVSKEVFWIFLHNLNVIALPESKDGDRECTGESIEIKPEILSQQNLDSSHSYLYMKKHFPQERAPIPAAPYVGGVEWEATNYLASHLDLVNGILACLISLKERNELREKMLVSGWEKCMGGTLRLCKEKLYGSVHSGLSCWVAAAEDDGWDTKYVRYGSCAKGQKASFKEVKNEGVIAPKIALKFMATETKPESCETWI